jgi:hypothetical protein
VNDILVDAELDARALGRSKSVRHIVISPDQLLTEAQRDEAIQMIRDEFGMGDRPIYLVEHVKERSNGTKVHHFHGLLAETYGYGNQIEHAHFKRRNEKLARKMELRFGHNLTKGRHNKAVQNALKREGSMAEAAAIQHLTEGGPALSKYGNKSHQTPKRLGYSLPDISQALTELQKGTAADIAAGLDRICEEHGVTVEKSDRRSAILIVAEDGTVLKNANRSLKIKAAQVDSILENVGKDNLYDRPANTGGVEGHDRGQLDGSVQLTGARNRADVTGDIPEPDARGASKGLGDDLTDQAGHDENIGAVGAERERGRGSDAAVAERNPRSNDYDGRDTAQAHRETGEDRKEIATNSIGRDARDATLTAVHKIKRKRAASELAPALAKAKQAVAGEKELTARHIIDRRRTAENMKPALQAAKRAIEGPKQATVQQKIQRNQAAQSVQDQLAAAKAAVAGETTPATVTPIQAIKRSRIAKSLSSALATARRAIFGDPQPTIQQKLQRAAAASALAPQIEAAKQAIFKEQIDAITTKEEAAAKAARREDDIELIDEGDNFKALSSSSNSTGDHGVRRQHDGDVRKNPADFRDGSGPQEGRSRDERDALDLGSDPGSNRGASERRERAVRDTSEYVSRAPGHQQRSGNSNADSGGRPESQSVSKSALAAHGQRYMANKAASGVRASRRSLEQSTKRMKNRHKGDMNISAAQAMLNERSGGSPQFASLDGDDFQALISFFQQNQATLRNTI